MKVGFVVALTLAVLLIGDVFGSPVPSGFGFGLPDLANMGHGFGAKIKNVIKGNTYDGLEKALKKISAKRQQTNASPEESGDVAENADSSLFSFSGKQFEQLFAMLQESQHPAGPDAQAPLASIDNSVD